MTSALFCRSILAAFLLALIGHALGHAGLEVPRPRRGGAFCCGNRGDGVGRGQATVPGNDCGLCGEDNRILSSEGVWRPRDSEFGGKRGRAGPTAVYREGQEILVWVAFWNPHKYFMEFRLSPNASWEITRNQTAFSYLLKVTPVSYDPKQNMSDPKTIPFVSQDPRFPTRVNINTGGSAIWTSAKVKLPAGVVCENCVLQLNYRARATESFRSCSDIRIIPAVTNPPFDLLKNKETGQCLSVGTPGTALQLAECNANDPRQSIIRFQSWKDYNTRSNSFALDSTDICIDSSRGKTAQGWLVKLAECATGSKTPSRNQRWAFKVVKDGSFQIVAEANGLCLVRNSTGTLVTKDCVKTLTNDIKAYSQFWTVIQGQVTPDKLPSDIDLSLNQNGVGYCPRREAGTPEGCWDIQPPKLDLTPPFPRLMNVETGKCLSHRADQSLMLATCNSNDPRQRLTLLQPWDNYKGWNHGIALDSVTTCVDYDVKWDHNGIGRPLFLKDCVVSVNGYKETQYWGAKMSPENQNLQIFSQARNVCLVAKRSSGDVYLNTCVTKPSVTTDYQYWTVADYPTETGHQPDLLFNQLKNDESDDKCLSQVLGEPMIVTKCDPTDSRQSVTLFQPWTVYEGTSHNGIALTSATTCLDVDSGAEWAAIKVRDCNVNERDDDPSQYWGTKKAENGTYQIFSKVYGSCITASRKTNQVWLYRCYKKWSEDNSNKQYWKFVDNQSKSSLPVTDIDMAG